MLYLPKLQFKHKAKSTNAAIDHLNKIFLNRWSMCIILQYFTQFIFRQKL